MIKPQKETIIPVNECFLWENQQIILQHYRKELMTMKVLGTISTELITPLISATAILLGTLVGGVCSWFVTKKNTTRNIRMQHKLVEDSRKYEEDKKLDKVCQYANIIRLDICTALFQSIRMLKDDKDNKRIVYPIPINSEYSTAVASLTGFYDIKEMSYIHQLYGIIEKLNNDIMKYSYIDNELYEAIKNDHKLFIEKLYGINKDKILYVNIDETSYTDLYKNDYIKEGYQKVLTKLDKTCAKEISKDIKNSKIKVTVQIMDNQLRVSGKDKDSLQEVISLVKGKDYGIDVQFTNYR